jgi:hypothetical protein
MRVEITKEIDPGDDTLEIPWAGPEKIGPPYVDLKAHPALADQLEECHRFPPLAEFLGQLNSPQSLFRTAKCDAWATTDLAEDERLDFRLPFKMGSYVDLLFDRSEFNTVLEHQIQLGERLRQALTSFRIQAQLEVCIRRCLFHPEERWGYYLTLFTHAYGVDADEAVREWARALEAQRKALMEIDVSLRRVWADSPDGSRRLS